MASKLEIKDRQSTLKKYLISQNLTMVYFYSNVYPLYKEDDFIRKFGELSESRVREDLKAIGYIYSKDEEAFVSKSIYIGEEAESQIIRCLHFMNLYEPFSVDLVPYNSDNGNNLCQFSYILLQYEKPKERIYAKYNIDNLLKNIRIYYDQVYNGSDLGELNIITTEKYIKFEFLNSEHLNRLYDHLKAWKSKEENPFSKKKLIRRK